MALKPLRTSKMEFNTKFSIFKESVDKAMQEYLHLIQANTPQPGMRDLTKAMGYSIDVGGHRIRPILSMMTAEALNHDVSEVTDLGCAIELIHTYSLIHDDLPCMDNDDFRRGKPSNHKVFGEALAVLAGDSLSTEAFRVLAKKYRHKPELALTLIEDLAEVAGPMGLVGGQAIDLLLRTHDLKREELEFLHNKKTGGLLKMSVLGAAKICDANPEEIKSLSNYADALGLTFQIADDIMDGANTDEPSFVKSIGEDGARKACEELVTQGCEALQPFGDRADGLRGLIKHVYERALT